jgi:signal transduction histidine kinase
VPHLWRLPRRRRRAAWVLAVVGPALITLGALPFRSSLGPAAVVSCVLLVVFAVGVTGGLRPALTTVALGFACGALFFARPVANQRTDSPGDLVTLVVFVVVGTVTAILVNDLARLAEEQAALGRVATLAARAAPADELFTAVTQETSQLLSVDHTRMGRYDSDGTATIVASWGRTGDRLPTDPAQVLGGENVSSLVWNAGRPARLRAAPRESGVAGSAVGTPIVVGGRLWGVMIAVSSSRKPLARDTEARLASFTDLVATAIANAESRADLAASRARIVATADATRRRIERDLHDGAQQRLVSLALELRAAQTSVPPELEALDDELSRVAEGLASVTDELREMARGIHPAILTEGGLGPALKTLVRRSPIPVDLAVRAEARLPERVEVATYYVVSETLTNAARHASASVVRVEVEAVGRALRVSVRDDGSGGADPNRGTGLLGLRDRVEALGGAITVQSPPGAGTSVDVELPIAG